MPIRHVADQFRTKWKRSSKTDVSATTESHPPSSTPSRVTDKGTAPAVTAPPTTTAAPTTAKKSAKTTAGPPPPPNPDYGLRGIGEYQFVEALGQGKFSKVVLARHYLTGEKVAIKMIDKRMHDYRILSRLVREVSLMEVLDHENIVHLIETFETADSLYLVMEYVPGVNLDEHLQQRPNRALSENEARKIFRQIVAAVDYCHSRWVVHRDLKAPNVLLTADGQVRLADFGLGNRFGVQRLKTICGSMLYYSPEIITGQKYVGPEIDCWCLGILLFRMTAGFEPFGHARTVGELKKDVVGGKYPMPGHLSESLQNTIRKCLSLDRRQRLGVKQALAGDPWLNDHGRLSDPFKAEADDAVQLRTDKELAKRDMEEEERRGFRIRKTPIYHPINTSIYFTGTIPATPDLEENLKALDLMRAELFQAVRSIIDQVQLRPLQNVSLVEIKSPINHIFRKFKPSSSSSPDSLSLRKTTSTLNISQLYKRVTKDQINYYSLEHNVRAISPTTAVSGYSSATLSTFSLENNVIAGQQGSQEQDAFELILLVRSACELLGVTYKHESKTQLLCILTMRNHVEKPSRRRSEAAGGGSTLQSGMHSGTSVPKQRRRSHLSHDSASSVGSERSWAERWHRGLRRISFPLLHQSNHAPAQGIWSNSIHLNSSAAPGSMASTGQHQQQRQQQQREQQDNSSPIPVMSEDGTATFTIEAFSVPLQKKVENHRRIVAVRFSNVKGSHKVFKLATGWISSVLASSNSNVSLNSSSSSSFQILK